MRAIVLWSVVGTLLPMVGVLRAAALDVPLTVAEPAGVERLDEPVTFGVPLPAGAAADPAAFSLVDASGKALPAGFTVAQCWLDESKSIRWLHVHTKLSVPANGTVKLRLLTNAAAPAATDSPLKVQIDAKAATATVVTGPVRLALSAHRPGVIESAWLGERQVIRGDDGSGVTVGGRTITEIDPGSAKVELLESGPMRAVVLLTGKFKDSNSAGAVGEYPGRELSAEGKDAGPGLIYEARVIACAGSPQVAIDYTIINKIGAQGHHKIDLEDLSLGWTLMGYGPDQAAIGLAGKLWTGKFMNRAAIFQDSVDHYRLDVDDAAAGEGPGKSAKPLTVGWANMTVGQTGLAVGVRDFWQMYPKALTLSSRKAGTHVRLGLYPKESGQPQELFIGQARSHRITLLLHDGQAGAERLNAVFAAANAPLMPVAEPDWYGRRTLAWGPIAPSDADYGPFAATAKHYDQVLDATMDSILDQLHNGRTSRDVTVDSYGWMNWGDTFFRKPAPGWGPTFAQPHKNLSWNGNYYDYGFAMICQFFRTGQRRYLDTGLLAGLYTADVFTTHYYPDPTLIGACHYCPPRYHAAGDNGMPYVSQEFNHAKVAGIVARWQMLGDHWARQVAHEVFECARTLRGSDGAGWRQCRGNGHRLRILWIAHQLTGDARYQDKARQLLALGVKFIKDNTEFDKAASQRFMVGIALEGMIVQHWDAPDPEVFNTIKFVADYALDEQQLKGYTQNMAMAYGFLWQQTGDAKYLRAMVRLLNAARPLDQAKIFGQSFRSTPWALGYLAEAAAKGAALPPPAPG